MQKYQNKIDCSKYKIKFVITSNATNKIIALLLPYYWINILSSVTAVLLRMLPKKNQNFCINVLLEAWSMSSSISGNFCIRLKDFKLEFKDSEFKYLLIFALGKR